MLASQVAELLTIDQQITGRPVDADIALTWHMLLGDLDYTDALATVREHYRTSDRRLMPVNLVEGCAALDVDRRTRREREQEERRLMLAALTKAGVTESEYTDNKNNRAWLEDHFGSKADDA